MAGSVAGADAVAGAHGVLTHALGSSFATAAIFDACALLVIMLVIRMRMARPAAVAVTDGS